MNRQRLPLLALLCLAAALLALPAAASARSEFVTSFDGTQIKVNFFATDSLGKGGRAPTVLFGPGWSQAGATDPEQASDPTVGFVGIGPLRAAGYNVLTWDPRGFGDSGGVVQVDSPEAEGRDVQELISYVARQPEAQLDRKNDPRVGMTGASYGGGIQLVAAGLDNRLDAIVPDIAWHSLTTSLYQDSTFKTGWGTILYSLGKAMGTLDPHIDSAYSSGQATGKISAEDEAWFASRGPGDLVDEITIPTMLVQGTVDTLFTLDESITNYRILRRNKVPVKLLWFCGGHGACLTDAGDPDRVENASIDWLDRWLKRDRSVRTGPGFDWINQDGERFTAKRYPPATPKPINATGKGSLPLAQAGGSGPSTSGPGTVGAIAGPTNGSRAQNALELTVDGAGADRQLVGAPRLTLDYKGTASDPDARVFAQLVDDQTDVVLGNQVTPIPLTLDGEAHQISRPLEAIAHTLRPGESISLQITSSATNYGVQRALGTVDFDNVGLSLPTVKPRVKRRSH